MYIVSLFEKEYRNIGKYICMHVLYICISTRLLFEYWPTYVLVKLLAVFCSVVYSLVFEHCCFSLANEKYLSSRKVLENLFLLTYFVNLFHLRVGEWHY